MAKQNQAHDIIELTKDGLEELKAELKDLLDVELPAVVARVAAAREHGDLSENSEYKGAKDDQTVIEARIAKIEAVLSKAKVVKQTRSHTKVGIGSKVVVVREDDKKKKYTYTIVGEFESDPSEGKISSVSPLGKALIGRKKGDQVVVEAPAGKINYLIKEIK